MAATSAEAAAIRAQLAIFDDLVAAPTGACSAAIDMMITRPSLSASGKRVLRTRAVTAGGERDSDSLRLICAP